MTEPVPTPAPGIIRGPRPLDQRFVAATWVRSILSMRTKGHFHGRHLRPERGLLDQLVDAVMDRSDSRLLVCSDRINRDAIRGWLVYVDGPKVPVVHYLYVRDDWRRSGIASSLLARIGVGRDSSVVCTSHGPASEMLRGRFPASAHVPLADFLSPGPGR